MTESEDFFGIGSGHPEAGAETSGGQIPDPVPAANSNISGSNPFASGIEIGTSNEGREMPGDLVTTTTDAVEMKTPSGEEIFSSGFEAETKTDDMFGLEEDAGNAGKDAGDSGHAQTALSDLGTLGDALPSVAQPEDATTGIQHLLSRNALHNTCTFGREGIANLLPLTFYRF